jgi:hypothetical protein
VGRHRTDPRGATRLLLAGLAVLALLGLIAGGVWALMGSLDPDEPAAETASARPIESTETNTSRTEGSGSAPKGESAKPDREKPDDEQDDDEQDEQSAKPSQPAAKATPGSVPTIYVECLAELCPVFLRIPGGDILVDRDLTRGEKATYFEPRIDVVLGDAATVRVLVNGEERKRGGEGERQTFTVSRPSPSPTPS